MFKILVLMLIFGFTTLALTEPKSPTYQQEVFAMRLFVASWIMFFSGAILLGGYAFISAARDLSSQLFQFLQGEGFSAGT